MAQPPPKKLPNSGVNTTLPLPGNFKTLRNIFETNSQYTKKPKQKEPIPNQTQVQALQNEIKRVQQTLTPPKTSPAIANIHLKYTIPIIETEKNTHPTHPTHNKTLINTGDVNIQNLITYFNNFSKSTPKLVKIETPKLTHILFKENKIQPNTLIVSSLPTQVCNQIKHITNLTDILNSSHQSKNINPNNVFLQQFNKNNTNPKKNQPAKTQTPAAAQLPTPPATLAATAPATTTLQQSTLPATLQPTKLPAISQATPPPAPETPNKLSPDDIKRLNELTNIQQKTFLKKLRTEYEAKKLSSKIKKITDDIFFKDNPDKDPKKIKYNFLRDILGIDKDGAINTLKGFFPNILRLPEKSAKAKLEEFKKKLDELNDKSVDLTNKYEADIAEIKIILNDKDRTKPELKLKVAYHQKIRELKIKASTDLAAITNPTDNDILEKEAEDKKAEAQLEEEAVAYAQLKASNKGGSRHLKAQKHKSTKAQKHKSTKAQTHKHTNTQTQKHKSTKAQKHKITKAQKHKSTKTQKHKSTKTQKHKTYVNNIIL